MTDDISDGKEELDELREAVREFLARQVPRDGRPRRHPDRGA